MFWRLGKNFLMDWINAYNQERVTVTINVGSKNKWKQRLNYSCGLFQHTLVIFFLMHLALWLTVNVFGEERCGENNCLKRIPRERLPAQL